MSVPWRSVITVPGGSLDCVAILREPRLIRQPTVLGWATLNELRVCRRDSLTLTRHLGSLPLNLINALSMEYFFLNNKNQPVPHANPATQHRGLRLCPNLSVACYSCALGAWTAPAPRRAKSLLPPATSNSHDFHFQLKVGERDLL